MAGHVLVVGGTGRTGRHVVEKLLERGRPVRVLTHDPSRARGSSGEGVEIFAGDVTQAESVAEAMRGADGAVVIVESAVSDAPNGPERAHYGGTRNVVAGALAGEGSAHVVLVSQIYITRPERYPEVGNVIRWRGRSEEVLRESGLSYTVVRPSWPTNESGGGGLTLRAGRYRRGAGLPQGRDDGVRRGARARGGQG